MEKNEQIENQIWLLKRTREQIDMNRTEFSRYMDIPLRTLEEWEAGRRQAPDYVLRLITYYVRMQQLLDRNKIKLEEMGHEQE